ncbi:hypothetical protein K7H22_01495 [Seohaeicola saemankumensis]|uniref:hypothetical protein n=1 Tax=Seohaeicola saemankumensis TaxID=481181 RepID=UPI001E6589CF|nr:hypothetical protein [Seohaeicola saemankumensis]MCD1624665.1 hypothetical protein [Seohaeicola saemankumensis]
MTRILSDGLFFHPDGMTAMDMLKRLADGSSHHGFDNPFAPALAETDEKIARLKQQIRDAEQRVALLNSELERAQQRRADQQEALARFVETGEVDPILVPDCAKLAEDEAAKQRAAIKEQVQFTLPKELEADGWSQKGDVQVTDSEIIVTIRKPRTDLPINVDLEASKIVAKVKEAVKPFSEEGSVYRFALRERIAARPQQPREPPS